MEWHSRDVPWWNDLAVRTGGSGPILEDGYIDVPEGPGLGVEINRDLAERYLTDDSELIV
jgi:L-alanine-DL-glutamate epimerase-like enolase superfamily enzyme